MLANEFADVSPSVFALHVMYGTQDAVPLLLDETRRALEDTTIAKKSELSSAFVVSFSF